MDNILISIVRTYQWASPAYLETLYCDALDSFGLMTWFNDIEEQNKQLEAKYKVK